MRASPLLLLSLILSLNSAEALPTRAEVKDLCRKSLVSLKKSPATIKNASARTAKNIWDDAQSWIKKLQSRRQQKKEQEKKSTASKNPPPSPRNYQAHNKDTDRPSDPNQGSTEWASVNVPNIQYWKQINLHTLRPSTAHWKTSAVLNLSDRALATGDSDIILRTSGTLIPSGYEPLASDGVTRDLTDNYVIPPAENFREIKLQPVQPRELSPLEEKIYTSTDHKNKENFPDWLSQFVWDLKKLHRTGRISDQDVASALTLYIRQKLLYRVDENSDVGVYEMTRSEKCQCEGAASILATILRQDFQIPSRLAIGFTGSRPKANPQHSVVLSTGEGHAWLEVYNRKTKVWDIYDATPQKKDREKDNKGQENPDYEQIKNEEASAEPQKSEDSQKPEPSNEQRPKNEKNEKIDQQKLNEAFLKGMWSQSLRTMEDKDQFIRSMEKVKKMAADLKNDALAQKADEFRKMAEHSAFDLKNLSTQIDAWTSREHMKDPDPYLKWKLESLQKILQELATTSTLTPQEATLKNEIQKILRKIKEAEKIQPDNSMNVDDTVAEILLSSLPGPLSRTYLREKYKTSTGALDSARLLKDIQSGQLTEIVSLASLKQYLNLWLSSNMKPMNMKQFSDPVSYVTEADPELDLATSLDRPDLWHRDGSSSAEMDPIRVLTGDMLMNVYPEDTATTKGRIYRKPSILSILVMDDSGSFEFDDGLRRITRDRLALAYIDQSQRIVAEQKGKHAIKGFYYRNSPGEVFELSNLQQAKEYFNSNLNRSAKADNGNDTAVALEKAYEMAAQNAQKLGLHRVNIILITDGQEDIDVSKIALARNKIPKNVDVRLSVLTVAVGNNDLRELAESSNGVRKTKLGVVNHHHISLKEMKDANDLSTLIRSTIEKAEAYNLDATKSLTAEDLEGLKDALKQDRFSDAEREKIENLAQTLNEVVHAAQKPSSSAKQSLISEFQRLCLQSNSVFNRAEKWRLLFDYLQEIYKKTGINAREVFQSATPGELNDLKGWLK